MKKLAKYLDLFLKTGFWLIIISIPLMLILIVGYYTLLSEFDIPKTMQIETIFDYHGLRFIMNSGVENNIYTTYMTSIPILVAELALLYSIVQIRGILEGVLEDKPFSMEVIRCVKKLAFGIMIGSFITSIVQTITDHLVFNHLNLLGIFNQIEVQFNDAFSIFEGSLIIEGLLVLLLAHVFQYGLHLQEEYDATL